MPFLIKVRRDSEYKLSSGQENGQVERLRFLML